MISLLCPVLLVFAAVHVRGDGPQFMRGISGTEETQWLNDVNATHVRRYVMWRHVEHVVYSYNASLTVDDVRSNPEVMVYQWAETKDWSGLDASIQSVVNAGVTPVVEVGEGTVYGLPRMQSSTSTNVVLFDPGVVGVETYLAHQYRFCRAAVHRYKDRVSLWQVENELNEALLESLAGVRMNTAPWRNWTFLTELLHTLHLSVKDEDAMLVTTTNLHTDVPSIVHETLHLDGFYVDAARAWGTIVDIISIDAYPNFFIADPPLGHVIAERIANVSAVVPPSGRSGIFVMETGQPCDDANANQSSSIPSSLRFDEERQAAYVASVYNAIKSSGASGMFYFELTKQPGMLPPPGGYTAEDASMFREIRNFLTTQNVTRLIDWLLEPGSLEEVLTRASYFAAAPDKGGWGLVRMDGSKRPAFDELKRVYSSNG